MLRKAARTLALKLDGMLRRQAGTERGLMHYSAKHGQAGRIASWRLLGLSAETCDAAGLTPLHLAVWHAKSQAAAELLKGPCGLDARDKEGTSALMLACMKGNAKAAGMLLEAGADWTARDKHGRTAADYARKRGEQDECAALLEAWPSMREKSLLSEGGLAEGKRGEGKRL